MGRSAHIRLGDWPSAQERDAGREATWAHASGWAQLSGSRRTISCVMPCGEDVRVVARLLPLLSDTLTECGYPWEVILVDTVGGQPRRDVLRSWSDLPGFRHVTAVDASTVTRGFAAGVLLARGDAVLFHEPAVRNSPALIPRMVMLWESGARLVHVREDRTHGSHDLHHWNEAETRGRLAADDFQLPPECSELGLLDRTVVDWILTGN
jgi:hypothetical protein